MKKSKLLVNKLCDYQDLHINEVQINGAELCSERAHATQLNIKQVDTLVTSRKNQDSSTNINWENNSKKQGNPDLYNCSICTTEFITKHRLRNHERATHGINNFLCIFCKEGFHLKKQLMTHVLVHKGAHGYKCDICFKVKPNYIMILRHLKTHGEKNIHCAHCEACFKTRWELKSHEIQHQKNRQFHCKMCGSTFINSGQLRCHMYTRCKENSYGCDICGKKFNTSGYLTNHKKIHFDEKPFKCQYCSVSFFTLSARKKHATGHEIVRQKPFVCGECGKEYTSTTSLAVHRMKFHRESETYQCQYCKHTFKTKASIIEHGNEHAAERPHSCKQCLCRYKNKRELNRHQREKSHFDVVCAVKEISHARKGNYTKILKTPVMSM